MRTLITLIAAAAALGGCAARNPGFGDAIHQNLTAQIADPDAKYARRLPPASNGPRTALGQTRYEKGQVIQPTSTATTSISITGGSGGGAPGGN
ncbi:MAG: hypothetical protein Q8M88_01940 [Phenylobacterium sp.]|uniref:hypothetical protein n=1 Tax=Phenylobacterium sp. TaxID=1871053 RepID=UPI0027331142|nr:hypothetical protein [Phenylobacterium sp.]MDP3173179.1 hypothetical protein [Phenylobacterium sp.]